MGWQGRDREKAAEMAEPGRKVHRGIWGRKSRQGADLEVGEDEEDLMIEIWRFLGVGTAPRRGRRRGAPAMSALLVTNGDGISPETKSKGQVDRESFAPSSGLPVTQQPTIPVTLGKSRSPHRIDPRPCDGP
jgi:hypothetical protein